jgi:ribonuclease D
LFVNLHQGDLPSSLFDGVGSVAIDSETMGLRLGRDPLCVVQIRAVDGEPHVVQLGRPGYDCPIVRTSRRSWSLPTC